VEIEVEVEVEIEVEVEVEVEEGKHAGRMANTPQGRRPSRIESFYGGF
jgi:hypothetical protein